MRFSSATPFWLCICLLWRNGLGWARNGAILPASFRGIA
jgi:hypothetical protein